MMTTRDKDGYITKMEYMQLSDKITKKQVIGKHNNKDSLKNNKDLLNSNSSQFLFHSIKLIVKKKQSLLLRFKRLF